ncbi:hypothetical protein F66182_5789 [Fusarium sp. NRRL 66182]|nr:hypothetical protein F66182_5789 [Fusarium sp. NRRL 66182]
MDGDILTFSELDFARLELMKRESNGVVAQHHSHLVQGFPFPHQNNEMPLNQGLLAHEFSDSQILTEPQSPFWFEPEVNMPSWQTPTLQSDLAQNTSPLAENRERAGTPTSNARSPTMGLQINFRASPAPGNQSPGLPRRRSRYFSPRTRDTVSDPMAIPRSKNHIDTTLDPMQRWQESPPEGEAASITAIVDALRETPLRTRSSAGSLGSQRIGSRAASIGSLGSATSCSSASVGSSRSRRRRGSSRGRVTKPRRTSAAKGKDNDKRRFPCTFCCDGFKSKYDWARHEKSLHLDLQGWRCTPFGGSVVSPDTGRSHCAYCSQLDPTPDHLETHNHDGCQNDEKPHVFSRKDHLVQHLRLVHHVKTLPIIDSWKVQGPPIASRCGICNIRIESWKERVEHLAKHFRDGKTMDDWKGEHCFEPHIAARVAHAMPPYMIASESKVPVPFSATDPDTRDQLLQIKERANRTLDIAQDGCRDSRDPDPFSEEASPVSQQDMAEDSSSMAFPEFLVLHLGQYARQQMSLGIMPTDAMFQTEARRIVYDTLDPWDQTMADNADWMSCFRSTYLGGSSSS